MKKRFVAILLALSVMLTLLPGSALAAEAGGEGTETLPPAVETETGGEAETEPPYEEEPEVTPAAGAEDPVPEEPAPAPEEPEEQDATVLLAESADGYTLVSTADELLQALWSSEPVYIRLAANIKLSNPLSLNEGKSVTLDLNGHELGASGGQAVSVGVGASLTLSNGRVDGGNGQAINVCGGTLAMENVVVTAAWPVLCTSSEGPSGGVSFGTILYIRGCELQGGSDGSRYAGLEVWEGCVDEITNTVITGGEYGIRMLQGGSIGTITSTAGGAKRTTVIGGRSGIDIMEGTIGRLENCDVLVSGDDSYGGVVLRESSITAITNCKIDGIIVQADSARSWIEALSGCEIQGQVQLNGQTWTTGNGIGSIANCTFSGGAGSMNGNTLINVRYSKAGPISGCEMVIPCDDNRSYCGITVEGGSVGAITGCRFTSAGSGGGVIWIGKDGAVDAVGENTFLYSGADTSAYAYQYMININIAGTLGELGENTAVGLMGEVRSQGLIRRVAAQGAWDTNNPQLFTAARGNWTLRNGGMTGAPDFVATEAGLRDALARGAALITLGADIQLSSPLALPRLQLLLDLGGYTLTGAITVPAEITATIRNGTISSSGGSVPTVSVTGGHLTLENATVTGVCPLYCADGVWGDSLNPERDFLGSIQVQNCQIVGSPVPAEASDPGAYCGIQIAGPAYAGVIGSTVTGGYVGIRQDVGTKEIENAGRLSLYIGEGSTVESLSTRPGACAIENVRGILDASQATLRTAAYSPDTAAIRNRADGVIEYFYGRIQLAGSIDIYNEGIVENLTELGGQRVPGQWLNNGTIFRSEEGWVLHQGAAVPQGLTTLATPTDLRWGDAANPSTGIICWTPNGIPKGTVLSVQVYRKDSNGAYVYRDYRTEAAGPDPVENLDFLLNCLDGSYSSGTYYFTVQAVGDYQTAASSAIAVSPEWTYTAPASRPRLQVEEIPWDGQSIGFRAAPANLVYGYMTALYFWPEDGGEEQAVAFNFDKGQTTSLTLRWIKDRIRENGNLAGRYGIRAWAVSGDLNQILTGSYRTAFYTYDPLANPDVDATLDDLTKNETATPQEIQNAVADIGAEKLLDAMTEENGGDEIAGMLTKLEEKMTNVETTVTVTGDIGNSISMEDVSVVGAALNADTSSTSGGSVEVKLQIGAASAAAPAIPEGMYRNSVNFSMTMTGVKDSENLAVPVQITLPVPAGINPDKLVVLHHRSDGTTETVPCKIKTENGSSYAVFCVTGFSDFTMTESVSGAVLGRLTVNEDGSGSVKVSGSAVTLAVASYDGAGKMLGMQAFSVSGSQTFDFRLPQGRTVKAFVLEGGSWRPVTLAETR